MNDLEMITSKICSAREIIDSAAESIQKSDYEKAESLVNAAYEFLGYYLEEFDDKFKKAWKETVVAQKSVEKELFEAAIAEREYYEGYDYDAAGAKFPLSCDKDDKSPECQKSWNDFWEETYYPEEYKKAKEPKVEDVMPPWGHSDMEALRYTEEELNAMCDKAASEQEKEKCREYNLREAEYYDKRAKLDADYAAIKAAGGYEWTPLPETKKDVVKKWRLPVEEVRDEDTGKDEYCVTFPDDLLEAANLKEGDSIEWVDQGDGSYLLKKIEKEPMTYDEMIAAGWTMTADGFWIKE